MLKRKILPGLLLSLFFILGIIKQASSEEVKIHFFSPPIIEAESQIPLSWVIQGGKVTKTQAFWRLIPQEALSEILKNYQGPKTYTSEEFSFDSSLYTKGKEFSGEEKIYLDNTFAAPSLPEDSPPFIQIVISAAVDGTDYYSSRIIRIIEPEEENNPSESRTSTSTYFSSSPEEVHTTKVTPVSCIEYGENDVWTWQYESSPPNCYWSARDEDMCAEEYWNGTLYDRRCGYIREYSELRFEIPQIESDEEIVCAILDGGDDCFVYRWSGPEYISADGAVGHDSIWFDVTDSVSPGSTVTITIRATGAPWDEWWYLSDPSGEWSEHVWGIGAWAAGKNPILTLHLAPKKLIEKYGRKCLCPCYSFLSTLNLSNGNLYLEKEITSTSGTGLTTNLTLSYNSLDSYIGPLGKGFTHNYNLNLTESTDTITLMAEDGERIKFVLTEDNKYEPQDKSGDHSILIKNTDATYLLTRKYGTEYLFNSSGKLTTMEDRNGNLQTFAYNASGNLIQITDSSGRITTLSYTDNKVISVSDPAGKTTTFEYNGDNLIKISDPLGNTFSYTYDENNRMITKTDPKGNVVTYTYDEEGRISSGKLNDEPPHAITYDEENNKGTATDPQGNTTTYSYDKDLNALTGLEDSESNITTNTFDAHRNLTTTTDQEANTTSYTYDDKGNLLTLTDPEDNTTTYSYELGYNQITSITDTRGDKISYAYDKKGNLTTITDPDDKTTDYGYDEKGELISITNPEGQSTSFEYDEYGNLSKITDNSGNTTSFTYDVSGNITSRTDPEGNTTLFEYNALNQLIKITDPKGNTTLFTYDANGNRTSSTDALGNTTSYEYNGRDRLIKVTDSKGGITQYGYDSNGNRTSIIDANGNTTTYSYDSLNRLIKETDPEGNTISYSYDSKGNLISRTDANGVTTNYAYNSLNRLVSTLYPEDLYVNYSYDSIGNLIHFDDNINNLDVNYTYDKLKRLTKLDIASKGSISYEYDSLGNRIKMTDPEGKITTYSHDELNRLIALTNPDNLTTSYEYDNLGRKVRMNYPNNTYTTYSYDERGNLINLTNYGRHNKIISSYDYTYDALGNRLTRQEKSVGVRFIEPAITYYKYDSLYQLTEAKSSKDWDIAYDYDPVGNRVVARFTGPAASKKIHPLTEVNYSYNSANQLIKEEQTIGRKGIPVKTTNYGYDGNGNQVLKYLTFTPTTPPPLRGRMKEGGKEFITSFAYDPENRLTGITYSTPHIFKKRTRTNNFAYCAFGKRIYKSDSLGDTYYFYDGDNILLELDSQNRTLARYTTGLGIDEWISKTTYTATFPLPLRERMKVRGKKSKTIYYHYDGLGSVVALTNEKGNVIKKYNYSPFGTIVSQGIASPYLAPTRERAHNYFPSSKRNTITYTGREYDRDSGLYFYRARYYDSRVGRFLSKDPLSFGSFSSGGGCVPCGGGSPAFISPEVFYTPKQLHPYVYVTNNPINYKDPKGLQIPKWTCPTVKPPIVMCCLFPQVRIGYCEGCKTECFVHCNELKSKDQDWCSTACTIAYGACLAEAGLYTKRCPHFIYLGP